VRYRAGTGAKSQNDVEGVSDATLGNDRGGRLLHYRGLDRQRTTAIHGAVLHRAVDETSGGRWDVRGELPN
jgi:hypothetical protein